MHRAMIRSCPTGRACSDAANHRGAEGATKLYHKKLYHGMPWYPSLLGSLSCTRSVPVGQCFERCRLCCGVGHGKCNSQVAKFNTLAWAVFPGCRMTVVS